MENHFREDKERKDRLFSDLIYDIGYEQTNDICAEADSLLEEYGDMELSDVLDEKILRHIRAVDKKNRMQKKY